MSTHTTAQTRNLALLGHAGAGKTSLTEALLRSAGAVTQAGSIDQKNTLSDGNAFEKDHGHSLFLTVTHALPNQKTHDTHLTLLDTPGYPDFMGQAISALPAVETAAIVVSAVDGVQPMTRRMFEAAGERQLCRMVIINKIDAAGADPQAVLAQVQDQLNAACLPVNLPADQNASVTDCFRATKGESDLGSVADHHTRLIDQVVEVDEKLMELYLEQGEVSPEQLHEPFEQAMREGHLIPVCFTASRAHDHPEQPVGIDELLANIAALAPNPTEGNPRPFIRGMDMDHELHAEPNPDKHVLAHVFAVRIDAFVGKLAAFRVHQGTVTRDTQLYIDDPKLGESRKPFKVGHLFRLQGEKHVEIDKAVPGDIVAVAKVDEVVFDAVLHDSHDEDNIHLRPLRFPHAMAALAVTVESRGDEQKLADALHKLAQEDPTFTVTREETTKETVIHGLGDLHLRLMLQQLRERFNVEVETHTPRIAYREAILGKGDGHCRHKKQTGGAGQFGEVYLRVEPAERGEGLLFTNDTFGGSIPSSLIPAVEKGVHQAMQAGPVGGYPMQDLKVSVYDGKHHPVDSKEIAFITAGKHAFLDAVQQANPVLLEPMVTMRVMTPDSALGEITADLANRRGRIMGTDTAPGGMSEVTALAPLSEVQGYQATLKSVTAGQGFYTLENAGYEPVPSHMVASVTQQDRALAEV